MAFFAGFQDLHVAVEGMYFTKKIVSGRVYRVAGQSIRAPGIRAPYARQVVLGPEDSDSVNSKLLEKVGSQRLGDTAALVWVAEKLDLVRIIDNACGTTPEPKKPSIGEMVLAVAVQRVCKPGGKSSLGKFLDSSIPRVACLPGKNFTGQLFYNQAQKVTPKQLEQAQVALAKNAVEKFNLATNVLAFDSTNFDTYIATQSKSELAKRGHAKTKRKDLRVVGLAVLASETGQVPLLHVAYPGNESDQTVMQNTLDGLTDLHEALKSATPKRQNQSAQRTVVRDGGFWSEQLELELEDRNFGSIISLPMRHKAAQAALLEAAKPRAMRPLGGKLANTKACRLENRDVGELKRTLVVVQSQKLLEGQLRGIAKALEKATKELDLLKRKAASGKISQEMLEHRIKKALGKERLKDFVDYKISEKNGKLNLAYQVNAKKRKEMERIYLGKRVLCTNRSTWSTGRIVWAFRSQWNVEDIFRRSKGGEVAAWGRSYQRVDTSLRLHTFATVLGLMLVALAKLHLNTKTVCKKNDGIFR